MSNPCKKKKFNRLLSLALVHVALGQVAKRREQAITQHPYKWRQSPELLPRQIQTFNKQALRGCVGCIGSAYGF
jgi:hypothetical protein